MDRCDSLRWGFWGQREEGKRGVFFLGFFFVRIILVILEIYFSILWGCENPLFPTPNSLYRDQACQSVSVIFILANPAKRLASFGLFSLYILAAVPAGGTRWPKQVRGETRIARGLDRRGREHSGLALGSTILRVSHTSGCERSLSRPRYFLSRDIDDFWESNRLKLRFQRRWIWPWWWMAGGWYVSFHARQNGQCSAKLRPSIPAAWEVWIM